MSLDDFRVAVVGLTGGRESLWVRLLRSAAYSGSGAGHPTPISRAPISMSVVSLTVEIHQATWEAAEEYGSASADVPARLLGLLAHLDRHPDPDVASWWANACRDWISRARVALGLTAPGTRWIRGIACPLCGAATARGYLDGEPVRTPALAVIWSDDDGSAGWRVTSITCRACGSIWTRDAGDLAGLAVHLLAYPA